MCIRDRNIYFVCKANLIFLGNIQSIGFEKEQPVVESGVLSVSLDRDPAQYDVNEEITMTICTTSDVVGLSPVSYTHLDVYKRQV